VSRWARVGNRQADDRIGSVQAKGYRLRMPLWRRALLTCLLAVIGLFFVPNIFAPGLPFWWRGLSAVGLLTAIAGLRIVLGSVVVVRARGLRVQRNWPIRREIPWYRILEIDVIPGFWNLEVELNSGERLSLPCVEDLEDLYRRMEHHRQALDA
jgi:hypothetical protein